MNLFFTLAFAALMATVATLILGVRSMSHGGREDEAASTRLMFRRVEFQAAAVALLVAGALFAGGLIDTGEPESDRLAIDLGVVRAAQILEQFGPDSTEGRAYGGVPDAEDAFLVSVAVRDRAQGRRIDDAEVTAAVGMPGMSTTSKSLVPATLAGATTYGNYFRMPKAGTYRIDVRVNRPDVSGTDLVRLEYHRY